jgi:hypothetical protein
MIMLLSFTCAQTPRHAAMWSEKEEAQVERTTAVNKKSVMFLGV